MSYQTKRSTRCALSVVVALSLSVWWMPAEASNKKVLMVDDDGVQCPEAEHSTIQSAVDAASMMNGRVIIRVCPGRYPENVVIQTERKLLIVGTGPEVSVVTGVAGTEGPVFDVTGGGKVSIKNLIVDGESLLDGPVVWGIRYRESSGLIFGVEVANIRNADGSSQGVGISAESSGERVSVVVAKNVVSNVTRVGIRANGPGITLHANGNRVVGPSLPKVWAPNGIQISRGARGVVVKNEIHDATSPVPENGGGSGILLFCSDSSRVRQNIVLLSDLGVVVADNAGARVERNHILDSVSDGISIQRVGSFFGDPGCPDGIPVTENNTFFRNHVSDSGRHGLSMISFDPELGPVPTHNRVSKNTILDSGFSGIEVFHGTSNRFFRNFVRQSAVQDLEDQTVGSGTLGTDNDWKRNRCLTSSPDGLCVHP